MGKILNYRFTILNWSKMWSKLRFGSTNDILDGDPPLGSQLLLFERFEMTVAIFKRLDKNLSLFEKFEVSTAIIHFSSTCINHCS